jgi:hypothetical protein
MVDPLITFKIASVDLSRSKYVLSWAKNALIIVRIYG